MKKRTIISLLLVACMATMCFVGGTFAKYTSTYYANDTVRVAKWAVGATGLTETDAFVSGDSVTVQLFDTVVVDEAADNFTTDDANVKNGGTNETIIAPGTKGSFSFDLANTSEVVATYTITYTVDEKEVPLQWSVDGTTWKATLAEAVATDATYTTGDLAIETGTLAKTVYWKWAYTTDAVEAGQTDVKDTQLGEAGTLAEPSVKIMVVFDQKN